MAAIDKMYGTPVEWEQMRAWFKTNLPQALPYMGPRPDHQENGMLCNLPMELDRRIWALRDSAPAFILRQLHRQYLDPAKRLGAPQSEGRT